MTASADVIVCRGCIDQSSEEGGWTMLQMESEGQTDVWTDRQTWIRGIYCTSIVLMYLLL